MIETLISSKTRIKLLLKFFLNSKTTAYLRSLESEFGESSNAIRVELNRLEQAEMLISCMNGNKRIFRANTRHPLFGEIHNIMVKYTGLDLIVANVIDRMDAVDRVFVVGEFSRGLDSRILDLVFIGDIDKSHLVNLIDEAEELINRKIRYLTYSKREFEKLNWPNCEPDAFLLWSR